MNFTPFSALAMHVPDGFLSVPVSIFGLAAAGLMLVLASMRIRAVNGRQRAAFVGTLAALIFAGQMLNFPIIGGTSGHLVGAVLAAILLGPAASVLTLASVLVVQALVFHDGGVLTLGFNIINMGLGGVIGYGIYRAILNWRGDTARNRTIGAGAAAWSSVVLGAAAVAVELAVSGTIPLSVALPAMIGVHILIGVGEALITVGTLAVLDRMAQRQQQVHTLRWTAVGLAAALAITLVSPFASALPDGLERVALDLGFADNAVSLFNGLLSDYALPFISDPALATIGAGMLGVLILGAMAVVLSVGMPRSMPEKR